MRMMRAATTRLSLSAPGKAPSSTVAATAAAIGVEQMDAKAASALRAACACCIGGAGGAGSELCVRVRV